ncbi:hypothetical protein MA4S0726RA_4766 [Mycobacteroides abscessus 4S-0726-RA]|nr:hypothetical protein MA4S0303_4831 [Mycobacteroides abscessus 4S-0303]EIT96569.1 hypothetical protein MA4S0726RA_4766 [Mycobacteroides abscessus 4S-0726-RA]
MAVSCPARAVFVAVIASPDTVLPPQPTTVSATADMSAM